jgi:hypothetical protein
MTAKKDFKRRVRERQARTGESYTAARVQVCAQAPEIKPAPFVVEEMCDLTAQAAQLGFRCEILASSFLVPRVDAALVLDKLRDALLATTADVGLERLRAMALRGEHMGGIATSDLYHQEWRRATRTFIDRVRGGIGGVSGNGDMMTLAVPSIGGVLQVICHMGHVALGGRLVARERPPRLILTTLEGLTSLRG